MVALVAVPAAASPLEAAVAEMDTPPPHSFVAVQFSPAAPTVLTA